MNYLKLPLDKDKRYFVVGDLHGRLGYLKILLARVGFNSNDVLIAVGDLIDRGKESAQLAEWFHKTPNAYTVTGNHELMALAAMDVMELDDDYVKMRNFWIWNGGETTVQSLENYNQTEDWLYPLISQLPYVIDVGEDNEEGCFRVVHAMVPLEWDNEQLLKELEDGNHLSLERLVWSREVRTSARYIGDMETFAEKVTQPRKTFVGHTTTRGEVMRISNVFWIDTGHKVLTMCEALSGKIESVEGLGHYE